MSVSPANGTTATAAATLTQSSSGTALLVRVWSLAGTQSSSEFGADPASSNFGTTSAGAGHRICASSLAMDCRGLIADPVCSCPDGGLQQNNSKSQWVGSGHQWLDQRVGNGMAVGCNGSARVGSVAAVVCNGSELSPPCAALSLHRARGTNNLLHHHAMNHAIHSNPECDGAAP